MEAYVFEDAAAMGEVAHAFGPGFVHRGVIRNSAYRSRESELVRLGEVTASDCADIGPVRRLPVSGNGVALSAVSYQKSR
ncbi:MAG: hypothetical protein SFV54_03150 [Bryobacteraceae bacterium]|nr:hypothetical protein [Bryobacteraceae bacterium]